MLKLPFISKQKFVFSIGDDGAVLVLLQGSKVVSKLFAPSAAISDRREINTLLLKHPNVPIYVLLDSIEQTYSKQALPAVSAFSIGKLVKRRLDRDFSKTDIKGAVPLGRDTAGRKDWLYMFVSTPTTPMLVEWLDYFLSLPNTFGGLYLLPIEMENVVNLINKSFFKGDAAPKRWQFLVTHNKTGGFRQTILNNNKVVFTRLIRPGKDSLPDIVAGNIEQEIINTIDYLRRLGLGDDEPINIFAVVSGELKSSLETSKIRGKHLILFTPFEVTKMLGYDLSDGKDAKFSDILLATVFANSKSVLRLVNPRAKTLSNILVAYKISKLATIFIVPIILLYSAVAAFDIISVRSKVKDLEDKKARIEQEWKSIKNTDLYDIDDANKITDAMFIRSKLKDEGASPIDILEGFAKLGLDFIKLQSFTWSYNKDYTAEVSRKALVSTIMNVVFSTEGGGLDAMFKNYDFFSAAIQKEFLRYKVEVSKLPDRITLDTGTDSLPLQVKISTDLEAEQGQQGAMPGGAL